MPKDWSATVVGQWQYAQRVRPETYRCGFCGFYVYSELGWEVESQTVFTRICPQCNGPTFFPSTNLQVPGPKPGSSLTKLPTDILGLYEEARSSRSANAFTGTVMLCRKLLMHIAVEKGAQVGQSFVQYVQWLINERYAPKGAEQWVDYIRDRSNEANHQIVLMTAEDAEGLLKLTEQLLRNVYELSGLVPLMLASQSETNGNEQ